MTNSNIRSPHTSLWEEGDGSTCEGWIGHAGRASPGRGLWLACQTALCPATPCLLIKISVSQLESPNCLSDITASRVGVLSLRMYHIRLTSSPKFTCTTPIDAPAPHTTTKTNPHNYSQYP